MDVSKIKKGLFSIKKKPENENKTIPVKQTHEKITYNQYGFQQAGMLGGTIPGLRVSLQRIYFDFRQDIQINTLKQEELKKPYRIKIENCNGDIESLEKK